MKPRIKTGASAGRGKAGQGKAGRLQALVQALEKSPLDRDARRLLLALASDGAQEARPDLREGYLTVPARKNSVTTVIACVANGAGATLVARNFAQWRTISRSGAENRRLALTAEGREGARRLAAGDINPFLAQHISPVRKSGGADGSFVVVDEAESPLSWLASRKGRNGAAFLDPVQLAAGERFHRDIEMAQLLPRITADWSGLAASGGAGAGQGAVIADIAIAARRRIDHVHTALGLEMGGLLFDICGFQKGLELVERERQWPARSAKIVLRVALDQLAAHYGMASIAKGPEHSQRARHWGAPDFLPAIGDLLT